MENSSQVLTHKGRPLPYVLDEIENKISFGSTQMESLRAHCEKMATELALAKYSSDAAVKSTDTTQKLLKELINEIKDLRDDGKLQQEQIDQIRKEVDEFKESVNRRINQLHQMVYENRTGTSNIKRTWDGGWEMTNTLSEDFKVRSTFDENGNSTGHTAIFNVDTTTMGDSQRGLQCYSVGLSEDVYKQLTCDTGEDADAAVENEKTPHP